MIVLSRLALFNILYEQELRPLEFNNYSIQFSETWINYLKTQNQVKTLFIIETQLIENAIRNPEKKLNCYSLTANEDNTLIDMEQLDTIIREACQSFIYSHPKFVPVIALCLIKLLYFAKQKSEAQVRKSTNFPITHLFNHVTDPSLHRLIELTRKWFKLPG